MTEHIAAPSEVREDHGEHEPHPHVNYMAVFGALCALTVASVIADQIGGTIGKVLVVLAVLTVACMKATFVLLYFMHIKFEGKWKYALLAPTMILALAIIAALAPDIGLHYYDVQVPQNNVKVEPHGSAEAGEHPPKAPH